MMVVIGLGSPLLSDDGVGHKVVGTLEQQHHSGISFVTLHGDGMPLLDQLAGCEAAVIVDAVIDATRKPGEVVLQEVVSNGERPGCGHVSTIFETIEFGRLIGMDIPANNIWLVGIVAARVTEFGAKLSDEVDAAVPEACATVIACLDRMSRKAVNLPPQSP